MVVFVQFFKKESNAVQGYVSSQISLDPFFPKLGWGVSHALLPSLSSLGAFVVHYRGHKHVRLRNLLPRGKKTLFVQSSLGSKALKKSATFGHTKFPFLHHFRICFSGPLFWKNDGQLASQKSDRFPSKNTIKNVYTLFNLETFWKLSGFSVWNNEL